MKHNELKHEDHSETAQSYHRTEVAQCEMKGYKSSLESEQKALQVKSKLYRENNPEIAESYQGLR